MMKAWGPMSEAGMDDVEADARQMGEGATLGDTIYALSSGAPPAAVAIIRISGPGADAALAALAGRCRSRGARPCRRLRATAKCSIMR